MATGFYELLGVAPEADSAAIRAAWQEQVAVVVRKLRAAEARQLDLAPLEARREALAEAWAVLGDPPRRRRYDRFRELARDGLPQDPDQLWAAAGASMVDPAAAAALDVVRALSGLRVGEGFAAPRPAEEPAPERTASDRTASERTASERSAPERERAPAERPAPERAAPERPAEPAPVEARRPYLRSPDRLELDTSVPTDDLGRLIETYGPTGAYLRAIRETRGITLEQLGSVTRISLRFLDAMERDAFPELPSSTFVRGYLRTVLRALDALPAGEETEEFLEDWMARYHRARD